MPELPEVETTRRGIAPHVEGHAVERVIVRRRRLRWPVPVALERRLPGQLIERVCRRGKCLLLDTAAGSALLHLGMSGSLRVLPAVTPPGKHDHVDIDLSGGVALRLHDPRCFGSVLWQPPGTTHRLLAALGPEPLGPDFDGAYLHAVCRGRRRAIKALIMDSHVVVGVGNIYASEALFAAGIDPRRAAGRISAARCAKLAAAIRRTLEHAIRLGGTTLQDFTRPDGSAGHFRLELAVYGRAGEPCPRCGSAIRRAVIGGRSSFWCPHCQH